MAKGKNVGDKLIGLATREAVNQDKAQTLINAANATITRAFEANTVAELREAAYTKAANILADAGIS